MKFSEVRKDVPVPELRGQTRWPFYTMEVGDYIEVEGATREQVSTGCSNAKKKLKGKFVSRTLENGAIGVWRVT